MVQVSEQCIYIPFSDLILIFNQASRTLYYAHDLWCLILERRRSSYHSIACSPLTNIYTLPFQRLRSIGFQTAALARNWSSPRVMYTSSKCISLGEHIPESDHRQMFAIVLGSGIFLTFGRTSSGGTTLTAWDYMSDDAVLLDQQSWDMPILPHTVASRMYMEVEGKCRLAFFLGDASRLQKVW
jgi:hypothetical protein